MNATEQTSGQEVLKRPPKRFLIKMIACVCLFFGCVVLKNQTQKNEIPAWNMISDTVISGVDYRAAMEQVGQAIRDDRSIVPVFREIFSELFLFQAEDNQIQETVPVVSAADLSIELLSFEMSTEELQDDTGAEAFVLPGATANTTLGFAHTTPLYGVVTSPFGYRQHPILQSRSFHTGIDIAGALGDPIGAFADGTVLDVGYNNVYGNYLLLAHGEIYRSFYGHCSKLLVKEGQTVSIGQTIAEVGTTGLSTGPHLHFEVRRGGTRLDPALFIIPNP